MPCPQDVNIACQFFFTDQGTKDKDETDLLVTANICFLLR